MIKYLEILSQRISQHLSSVGEHPNKNNNVINELFYDLILEKVLELNP